MDLVSRIDALLIELLHAHHQVEEARRLVEEAAGALEFEKASLADRRPAN